LHNPAKKQTNYNADKNNLLGGVR